MPQRVRTVKVGSFEIVSLPDARGSFGTYAELFPSVSARSWGPYKKLYPDLFTGDAWVVPFTSFLVRGPSATVLVDTGLGPDASREPDFMPDRQGWLPDSLTTADVMVEDIDAVFLTHHHSDHIGWNLYNDRAAFPNARYMTGADAWRWTLENRTESYILDSLLPLRPAVTLVEDGHEIMPGLTAIATPGHYPGHLALELESDGPRALILGDVAVHPAQLRHPEWAYAFDVDPETAAATRKSIVRNLDPDTIVACGHFPGGGIGRMRDGEWVRY